MNSRIDRHPIITIDEREDVVFYWNGMPLKAKIGETVSSALIANGVYTFGHHKKDGTGQGIFCANGQCSKCMIIAEGIPVKSCMTTVRESMRVESVESLPELPRDVQKSNYNDIETIATRVLIIGGGPAGLSAALELGKAGIDAIVIDDKNKPGGKLVLQTHKFFGSVEDSRAGTRGNDIGRSLSDAVFDNKKVDIWLDSTVLFVFKDRKVGILKQGRYVLVTPEIILNTAGAREKFLRFQGNHLIGIYGAGAFQTLVNRDLVHPSKRLFVIGGGNVGLISAYHALQAGIEVVGIAEAMKECGGYKVHADKIKRLGVPVYTSHSIISANGGEGVESITITRVDEGFRPIPGTEKTFRCDTVLIAVGLNSISEFTYEAGKAGIPVYSAGDAMEIAEASSAMFNGKIAGMEIASALGADIPGIPESWFKKADILKSHPGNVYPQKFPGPEKGVMPIIHCLQEIPCNPCTTVCPTKSIVINSDNIMGIPEYKGECIGCAKCVLICPGLAITLVDYRKDPDCPEVTVPYEIFNRRVGAGDSIEVVDIDGESLGNVAVSRVVQNSEHKTQLIRFKADKAVAKRIVSFRVQNCDASKPVESPVIQDSDGNERYVCLCERVKESEVRELIRKGITDINQIKAITRAGMGSCGSKTCETLIKQIFREEGVPADKITSNTIRPVFVEVPFGAFAGMELGEKGKKHEKYL